MEPLNPNVGVLGGPSGNSCEGRGGACVGVGARDDELEDVVFVTEELLLLVFFHNFLN